MFYDFGYNAIPKVNMNLSGWNVNKVVSYSGFNYGKTSNIIAPTWKN